MKNLSLEINYPTCELITHAILCTFLYKLFSLSLYIYLSPKARNIGKGKRKIFNRNSSGYIVNYGFLSLRNSSQFVNFSFFSFFLFFSSRCHVVTRLQPVVAFVIGATRSRKRERRKKGRRERKKEARRVIIFAEVRKRKRSLHVAQTEHRVLPSPSPPPAPFRRSRHFSLSLRFLVALYFYRRCAVHNVCIYIYIIIIRWSDAIIIWETSKRLKICSHHLSSFRLISHSNFIYCQENKFNGIITRSPSITSPLCGEFYFQTIALREWGEFTRRDFFFCSFSFFILLLLLLCTI